MKLCQASRSCLLVLLWQLRHNSRTFALNRAVLSGAIPICSSQLSRKPRNLRSSTLPVPLLAADVRGVEVGLADATQMIWDLHDLGGADRIEAAGKLREWLLKRP